MTEDMTRGHRETQLDIPDPLGNARFWNPLTSGLPAYNLSWISILVLALVSLSSLVDEQMRHLFKLAVDPDWLAGVATLLAGSVLLSGESRPGRLFPRIWALVLTSSASLVFLFCLLARFLPSLANACGSPYLHTICLAILASAVSLLPRLARIRPDSPWVRRVAFVSLAWACFFVLPLTYFFGHRSVQEEEERVEASIRHLHRLTRIVRKTIRHDWTARWEDPDTAETVVEELELLTIPSAFEDPDFWRLAAALGKTDELKKAVREVMTVVVDGFHPRLLHKLSSVPEGDLIWDQDVEKFITRNELHQMISVVDRYHRELKRLFDSLNIDDRAVKDDESFDSLRESVEEMELDRSLQAAPRASDRSEPSPTFR